MGRIGELFEELVKEVAQLSGREIARHLGRPEPQTSRAQEATLLKPAEAAALLRKSVDWVRRRAQDGTLPHRKVGRDLRFLRREIEAWAEKQH